MELARILRGLLLNGGHIFRAPDLERVPHKKRQASGHAHAFLLPDRRRASGMKEFPESSGSPSEPCTSDLNYQLRLRLF